MSHYPDHAGTELSSGGLGGSGLAQHSFLSSQPSLLHHSQHQLAQQPPSSAAFHHRPTGAGSLSSPGTVSGGVRSGSGQMSSEAPLATPPMSGQGLRSRDVRLAGQPRYWTPEEHQRFLEALIRYGYKDVKAISNYVATRNPTQVRTHAQKFFLRLGREAQRSREKLEAERSGRPVEGPWSGSPDSGPASRSSSASRDETGALVGADYTPKEWSETQYQVFAARMDRHPLEPEVSKRCLEISRLHMPEFTPEELELIYYKQYVDDARARGRPVAPAALGPALPDTSLSGALGVQAGSVGSISNAAPRTPPVFSAGDSASGGTHLLSPGAVGTGRPAPLVPPSSLQTAALALSELRSPQRSPPPGGPLSKRARGSDADSLYLSHVLPMSPGTQLFGNMHLPLTPSLNLSPMTSPTSALFSQIFEHAMLPSREPVTPTGLGALMNSLGHAAQAALADGQQSTTAAPPAASSAPLTAAATPPPLTPTQVPLSPRLLSPFAAPDALSPVGQPGDFGAVSKADAAEPVEGDPAGSTVHATPQGHSGA